MKKILVATATYNEALNIKKLISKIINLNIKLDILVVDDNSPDKTWMILQELKDKYKNLHIIIRAGKNGLDSAHKKIYEFAIQNKYQYLITMDADLSHDPNVIPIFLKYIKKYDCVFGSRYIKGGKNDLKGYRLYLSKYGNNLIRFLLKINLSEFTTSYRCFNLLKLKKFNFNINVLSLIDPNVDFSSFLGEFSSVSIANSEENIYNLCLSVFTFLPELKYLGCSSPTNYSLSSRLIDLRLLEDIIGTGEAVLDCDATTLFFINFYHSCF